MKLKQKQIKKLKNLFSKKSIEVDLENSKSFLKIIHQQITNLIILILILIPLSQELKSDSELIHEKKELDRILEAEKELNQKISSINSSLETFSVLLSTKITKIPHKTILKLGEDSGQNCKFENHSEMNCFRIEIFDSVLNSKGETISYSSKFLELYFDELFKLKKTRSLFFIDSYSKKEKQYIEILDLAPFEIDKKEENLYIRFFLSGQKQNNEMQLSQEEGQLIPFQLLENSKYNPFRNQIKKEAIIKHLLHFQSTLSRIEFIEKK
jgi:hypothetical protein